MKLFCLLFQNQLSKLATTGKIPSPTSITHRHLASCSDCQMIYEELNELAGLLSRGVITPSSSEQFESNLLLRLENAPLPARNKQGRLATIAGVAFATLTLCLCVRQFSSLSRTREFSNDLTYKEISHTEDNPTTATIFRGNQTKLAKQDATPRQLIQATIQSYDKTKSSPIHAHRRRRVSPKRLPVVPSAQEAELSPEEVNEARGLISNHLALCANIIERNGDTQLAQDVYREAYEYQPSAELAYAAGRASEANGDIAQAISYYEASSNQSRQKENAP